MRWAGTPGSSSSCCAWLPWWSVWAGLRSTALSETPNPVCAQTFPITWTSTSDGCRGEWTSSNTGCPRAHSRTTSHFLPPFLLLDSLHDLRCWEFLVNRPLLRHTDTGARLLGPKGDVRPLEDTRNHFGQFSTQVAHCLLPSTEPHTKRLLFLKS